jgi:hypothetical protein
VASTLAEVAREAYVTGWAISGGPMTPRVAAGCEAAVRVALERCHHPDVLEVTLHLGHLEGTWAEVYKRRDELMAAHVAKVAAIWRNLVRRLDPRDLSTAYRRDLVMAEADDGKPSQRQRDVAKATALAWLLQVMSDPGYQDLDDAIAEALLAAQAEGRTATLAIAADQAAAAGFSWELAYAAMLAAIQDSGQQGTPGDVARLIMRTAAADAGRALAAGAASGAPGEDAATAAADEASGEDAVQAEIDHAMGWGFGCGALDLAAAEGIQLDWLTAGDIWVCFRCQANEDNGPYEPSAFPPLPAHNRCRCSPAPAQPLRFTAFAQFLVPVG